MQSEDYTRGLQTAAEANEPEEYAAVFATYYAEEVEGWRDYVAGGEPIPKLGIEGAALADARKCLDHYKAACARGHSSVWARTYARQYFYLESESEAVEAGYETLRAAGKAAGATQQEQDEAVQQEAIAARASYGPVYAAAYARAIADYEYDTADTYAAEVVKQLAAGKSALVAHEYAGSVANNYDPKYAILEAEVYERALLGGLPEGYARVYADKLATNLFDYAVTDEDIEFYTQEADKFIAERQRKDEEAARQRREAKNG